MPTALVIGAGPAGSTTALLLARRGWRVSPDNPARRTVVDVLTTYEALGEPELAAAIESYADAVEQLARREVDTVLERGERGRVVEGAVVGTVLGDRLIGGLRRLAQEDASWRRLGRHHEADAASAEEEAPGA
jgi:glycine/D-amino acid oxidase-like deaminating enzyme